MMSTKEEDGNCSGTVCAGASREGGGSGALRPGQSMELSSQSAGSSDCHGFQCPWNGVALSGGTSFGLEGRGCCLGIPYYAFPHLVPAHCEGDQLKQLSACNVLTNVLCERRYGQRNRGGVSGENAARTFQYAPQLIPPSSSYVPRVPGSFPFHIYSRSKDFHLPGTSEHRRGSEGPREDQEQNHRVDKRFQCNNTRETGTFTGVSTSSHQVAALGVPVMQNQSATTTQWSPQQQPSASPGGLPFQAGLTDTSKLCGEQSPSTSAVDGPQAGAACSEMRSQRSRVKGQWSTSEDKALVKLVKQYGTRRWSLISTYMSNRSGKQCRERWVNHLQPDIRKEGWTKEEEELLVQAHSCFGNKWSAIAKMLPGRTDNSIKNHWHAALRKKDRHGKLRSNLLREYIHQKLAKKDSQEEASHIQEAAEQTGIC